MDNSKKTERERVIFERIMQAARRLTREQRAALIRMLRTPKAPPPNKR